MSIRSFVDLPAFWAKPEIVHGLGPVLGKLGSLEVRLATSDKEIKKAQRLRYEVFYEEMQAVPDMRTRMTRRDKDRFDAICDHLLVLDHASLTPKGNPKIVGTYRLLRGEVASAQGGFYTSNEFDIGPALARHPNSRLLELGRSCVLKPYRNKRTVELLWHGIWAYVLHHKIDVLFGCASFETTNPSALAVPMRFLRTEARLDGDWNVRAANNRAAVIPPVETYEPKRALAALPPLIKGYLRLGAKFSADAVIDHAFGTTDVLVVLEVAAIESRYVQHFGADATRYAFAA
jgi:L-ornithine Nalpha-acyltransferase